MVVTAPVARAVMQPSFFNRNKVDNFLAMWTRRCHADSVPRRRIGIRYYRNLWFSRVVRGRRLGGSNLLCLPPMPKALVALCYRNCSTLTQHTLKRN
jgi:hypothetical protein